MGKIEWTESARNDLKAIYNYISQDSEYYAQRLSEKIITRIEILATFPLAGRVVPEKEDETIRELIEGNYRIFYQIAKQKQI
jgi:addiction module RelE/StbE family toxin